MAPKIQHKRSAVAGKVPQPADLDYGEIGVNYEATDPALYIKDSANAIRKIGTQPDATESVKGLVELATAAETTAGTDNTRAVHPQGLKVELDKKAPLASPALTGTPTAPTAAAGTKTTQLATTQFVADAQVFKRTGTVLEPATAGDTIKGNLLPTNGSLGFRNVIINGDLSINQRKVAITAAAVGQYGPDRWKKTGASTMTQIIENVNFVPGAKYTLSWKGGTPQVLTAPASGNWTLPNIPTTVTEIQLEPGEVATPFERRPPQIEVLLCERYYTNLAFKRGVTAAGALPMQYFTESIILPTFMARTPTVENPATGFPNRNIKFYDNSAWYVPTSIVFNYAGSKHVNINIQTTSNNLFVIGCDLEESAIIGFDAEL